MRLSETSKKLHHELILDYIFYIPTDLVDIIIKENIFTKKEIKHINTILFIDEKSIWVAEKHNATLYQLFTKGTRLKNNILTIFEHKEKLNKKPFNFILNEYIGQVKVFIIISEWLYDNFDDEINDELLIKFKSNFKNQIDHFKSHLEELKENFNFSNLRNVKIDVEFFKNLRNNHFPNKINTPEVDLNLISTKSLKLENFINNFKKGSFDLSQRGNKGDKNSLKNITLSVYIIHSKNELIKELIVKNFKTEKSKSIRCILEFLNSKDILPLGHGKKRIIYDCLENTFNREIGTYSSIWSCKIDKLQDKTYISIKKSLNNLFDENKIQ